MKLFRIRQTSFDFVPHTAIGNKVLSKVLNLQAVLLWSNLLWDAWDIVLVEHKDRLARFGVNYLGVLLEKQGKTIEIINNIQENKDDLMQDFVAIITSFTVRLYGLRRSQRKTEPIIKKLHENE
jgi:predicted site-specific integrase-resolvase